MVRGLLSDQDGECGGTPGQLLAGRFRLLEWLGSGTFADVWRAVDQEHGGGRRTVVVKVFPAASPEAGDRAWPAFRQEVVVCAHLGRRSRCLLPTAGVTVTRPDGVVVPMLVLPDVAGVNLAEWLQDEPRPGPASTPERVAVLGDVLVALAAVHEAGVAHRDIGFGNVIIGRRSAPGAWLTDFGSAQVGDAPATEVDAAAPSLRPLQLPPYGGGQALHVEQSRDVYAFAVVATLVLTGRHPLTDRWRELRTGAWRGDPDPHSTLPRRPLRELAPWLADDRDLRGLAALLDHCLSPSAQERPGTAGVVLAAWLGPLASR